MQSMSVPAIEVGGTHVAAALVDLRAQRVVAGTRREAPLRADGDDADILDTIAACARLPTAEGATWGVAIPGPFDYDRGVGRFTGVAKFESLNGVDVRRALLDRLRPTPGELRFLNDADAFGLGEWALGAAAGHRRMVAITIGTGIGSAFLADGEIVDDGPTVPPEGSVHLLTIGGAPLEDSVSRRAITRRYASLAGTDGVDVLEIAGRARRGERIAAIVLDEAFDMLGRVLGPWLARFGATVLVVGGAIAGSWDLLEPALRRGLLKSAAESARRLSVVPAVSPAEAGLIGAAHRAATLTRTEPSDESEGGGA